MELRERLGILYRDLGCERPRLHVPAFLQLEQVTAVTQNRAFGKPFLDAP